MSGYLEDWLELPDQREDSLPGPGVGRPERVVADQDSELDLVLHLHFRVGSGRNHVEGHEWCAVLDFIEEREVGLDDGAVGCGFRSDLAASESRNRDLQRSVFIGVRKLGENGEGMGGGKIFNPNGDQIVLGERREMLWTVRLQRLYACGVSGVQVGNEATAEPPRFRVDRELGWVNRLALYPTLQKVPLGEFPCQVVQRGAKVLERIGGDQTPSDGKLWDALEKELDGARIRVEFLSHAYRLEVVGGRILNRGFERLEVLVAPRHFGESAV